MATSFLLPFARELWISDFRHVEGTEKEYISQKIIWSDFRNEKQTDYQREDRALFFLFFMLWKV